MIWNKLEIFFSKQDVLDIEDVFDQNSGWKVRHWGEEGWGVANWPSKTSPHEKWHSQRTRTGQHFPGLWGQAEGQMEKVLEPKKSREHGGDLLGAVGAGEMNGCYLPAVKISVKWPTSEKAKYGWILVEIWIWYEVLGGESRGSGRENSKNIRVRSKDFYGEIRLTQSWNWRVSTFHLNLQRACVY